MLENRQWGRFGPPAGRGLTVYTTVTDKTRGMTYLSELATGAAAATVP